MIFIEKLEIEYLKDLLEKQQTTFWVKDHILDKLQAQEEEWQRRKECKHEYGEYIGNKKCCVFCGGFDIGMGESWTLNNPDQPAGRHRKATRKAITSDDGAGRDNQ